MRILMVMAILSGCVDYGYRDGLRELPSVDVRHSDEAVAIAAGELGLDLDAIGEVTWVVGGIRKPSGEPVAGVQIECDVWIAWWGASNTSGASSDGPAISHTSLAHELAHCALWLQGESDPDHARIEWWGPGGRVVRANDALIAAGL